MKTIIAISDRIDRFVSLVGKIAAWASVPMIAVIIFDVVLRRFFVIGSTRLQEMEWHLHTVLFLFCIGYAYLKDAHVRIDLVRANLGPRGRAAIELVGGLVLLVPYCAVILYFGWEFVARSFAYQEVSASGTGLPYRWLIKSAIPIGVGLVLLAGVAVLLRSAVTLFAGSPPGDDVRGSAGGGDGPG